MPFKCVWKPLACQCCGIGLPQRYIMALMCLIGAVVAYGQRCAMSIAITRMVSVPGKNRSESCLVPYGTLHEQKISGTKKIWSELDQNILLSTFYVGYLLFHIPAGLLADRYGGRWVYAGGHMAGSLVTAIMPLFITHLPIYAIAITRGVVGFGQAVTYPCVAALIAKWVPFDERSLLGAFAFAANALGTALGNLLSAGVMTVWASWPAVFYFWGVLGFIWFIFFITYVYSEPSTHPHITDKEKQHLKDAMPPAHFMKVPWRHMLFDKGILVLVICQIGSDYTWFFLLTNIPKYYSDVLHADVTTLSIVTSIPFVAMWIGSVISGRFVDYVLNVKKWNLKWVRRICTFVAFVSSATFSLLMVYMKCDHSLVTAMFTLAVFTKGPHFTTFKVNHMDITVNFNGIVMAYINGLGAIGGIVPPYIVGTIAANNTFAEWEVVFWISWAVSCSAGVIYLCLGQASRAKWDVPPEELEQWQKERDAIKAEGERKIEEKAKKKEEKAKRKAEQKAT